MGQHDQSDDLALADYVTPDCSCSHDDPERYDRLHRELGREEQRAADVARLNFLFSRGVPETLSASAAARIEQHLLSLPAPALVTVGQLIEDDFRAGAASTRSGETCS